MPLGPEETTVAVAVGSNIGDRVSHIEFAVGRLLPVLSSLRRSPLIDTEPQDVEPQPRFLNGALVGTTRLSARELLDLLLAIERERGRERPHRGAPRTLDLDLVLYGQQVIDGPDLHVPHPRFRERLFVLEPLASIAGEMVDPVTGMTVAQLLARLRMQGRCKAGGAGGVQGKGR